MAGDSEEGEAPSPTPEAVSDAAAPEGPRQELVGPDGSPLEPAAPDGSPLGLLTPDGLPQEPEPPSRWHSSMVRLRAFFGRVEAFFSRRVPPRVTAVCAFLALVLLAVVIGPVYATVDDAALSLMVAGLHDVTRPTSSLMVIHPWLGQALVLFNEWVPAVGWYGWLQVTGLCAAGAIWIAVFTDLRGLAGLLLGSALVIAVFVGNIFLIQYTKTAIALTFSGWMAVNYGSRRSRRLVLLGGALIVFGFFFRSSAAALTTAAAAPLFLRELYVSTREERIRLVSAVGVIAALVGLSWLGEQWHYSRDDRWDDFFQLTHAKSQFLDWGLVVYDDDTKPAFDREGWTRNDFDLINAWNYWDKDVFSPKKMNAIASAVIEKRGLPSRPWDKMAQTILTEDRICVISVGALLFFGAALFVSGTRGARATFLGAPLVAGTFLAYAYQRLYLPGHLYVPLSGMIALVSAYLVALDEKVFKRPLIVALTILVCCAAMYRSTSNLSERLETAHASHEAAEAAYVELSPKPSDIYVHFYSPIALDQLILPLDSLQHYSEWRAFGAGWIWRAPPVVDAMKSLGIDDVFDALVSDSRVITVALPDQLQLVKKFFREHRGKEVDFTPTGQANMYRGSVRSATR